MISAPGAAAARSPGPSGHPALHSCHPGPPRGGPNLTRPRQCSTRGPDRLTTRRDHCPGRSGPPCAPAGPPAAAHRPSCCRGAVKGLSTAGQAGGGGKMSGAPPRCAPRRAAGRHAAGMATHILPHTPRRPPSPAASPQGPAHGLAGEGHRTQAREPAQPEVSALQPPAAPRQTAALQCSRCCSPARTPQLLTPPQNWLAAAGRRTMATILASIWCPSELPGSVRHAGG